MAIPGRPKQSSSASCFYNRLWFDRDRFGSDHFLVADASTTLAAIWSFYRRQRCNSCLRAPYFTENPGDPFKGWDASVTTDYMPSQYFTYRLEYNIVRANVPTSRSRGRYSARRQHRRARDLLCPAGVPISQQRNRITGAFLVKFLARVAGNGAPRCGPATLLSDRSTKCARAIYWLCM